MTKNEQYDYLIWLANKKIEAIKKLPYYEIFNRKQEQEQDINKKLELIEWLKKRKNNEK